VRIQNNVTAVNASRQSGINSTNIAKTTEKLSSGFRVNRAADDAAGLAISEKLRTQIRGLSQASRNIQDGISLVQVGDGALQIITNLSQRIRELCVQAANDTNASLDRNAIQLEIAQLTSEVNQVIKSAEFNGMTLFDGSIGASYEYHLGLISLAMDRMPASITAGNPFAGSMSISPWTYPSSFGVSGTSYINTLDAQQSFPRVGIFAIQVQTPAHGSLAVVLDFAVANENGDFTQADFIKFFKDGFDQLSRDLGLDIDGDPDAVPPVLPSDPPVVADVRISASGQIILDFPKDSGGRPVGIMGMNGEAPRVHIGIGAASGYVYSMGSNGSLVYQSASQTYQIRWLNDSKMVTNSVNPINTSTVFANSAIFGASASSYYSNEGIKISIADLTPTEIATLESLMTANAATLSNNTDLWRLLPPGALFRFSAINYTGGAIVDTQSFTKGGLPGTVTTIAEFNSYLAGAAAASPHWNGMSVSPTLHRDRNGDFYVAFSRYASTASSATYASVNSHSTFFSSRNSATPTSTQMPAVPPGSSSYVTFFPASISEAIGLFEVTISNVPGLSSVTASIDFSATPKLKSVDSGDPFDPETLVGQINLQLNARRPTFPTPPNVFIPPPGYDPAFPVARASISANGNLVITASEREFSVRVNERMSDRPMMANFAEAQTASVAQNTLSVNVSGVRYNVNLVGGNYASAEEFVNANRNAFANAGFILSHAGENLIITTIQGGEHITVTPSSVSTDPPALLSQLGFGGPVANITENGQTLPTADPGGLWIQSGANRGDGVTIEMPRLCVRSLGLAMWRPLDQTSPWAGFAPLGAANYTTVANVDAALQFEPMGFSLDVMSHTNATNAISVVSNAINILSTERARMGAQQNRFEYTKANVDNTAENLSAAESRIRDADIAKEHSTLVKQQVLSQASNAMLAQANTLPQGVLQLLR